jgi:zeta-carotene desaturase
MRVAIVGAGLAGMATAIDLVDAGHEVEIFESRPFVGGKVGSWVDGDGNHIEMGLHVFFNNYANLFAMMQHIGATDIFYQRNTSIILLMRAVILASWIFDFSSAHLFTG